MTPKIVPPLNLALANLRVTRGVEQRALAKALGISASLLSEYERGRKPLTRGRLEELVAALGLPASTIDAALEYIHKVRAAEARAGVPGAPGEAGSDLAAEAGIEAEAAVASELAAAFVRGVLSRLARSARALVAAQRAEGEWRRLQAESPARRRLLVRKAEEFRSWGLCVRVCEESVRAAADKVEAALDLADLALLIAEVSPGGQAWRWRLRAYALYHLGNARRVKGELREAEEIFAEARRLWQDGDPGDPGLLNEARVFGIEAALRKDQRQLQDALTLTEKALAADQGGEAKHLLLNKANIQKLTGDYESALTTLRQAAPLVRVEREPRLASVLRFNWVVNLCHLERYAEAQALLPAVRELAVRLRNELDLVRTRWLEGRVDAGLGREEEARAAFEQMRREFRARDMAYDYALASLELAVLHLEAGRTREVRALAREMEWIFRAKGVHSAALAALQLFREAAERETATAELARRLVKYLHRAEHDPGLQFVAP